MTQRISISIIVPVYTGEKYLRALVDEIAEVRDTWSSDGTPFVLSEAVFVDDGAIDGSPEILEDIAAQRSWVTVLHMSRNFGQHAATISGILHSSGDWVVTLDEDLQHPPKAIGELLRKAAESGADVVYARGKDDIHESGLRDLSSRTFKKLAGWLTGNPDIRKMNSFRLIRGSIARAASSACIHDTYFDIAVSWFTKRIDDVSMKLKDERFIQTGKSGYRLRSLFSHARRMLVSSNLKVLRAVTFFGFVVFGISVLSSVLLFVARVLSFSEIAVVGWTSTMIAINLYGGISVMLIGLVLEYMSILIQRAHGRPLFFVIDRSSDNELKTYFSTRES